MASISELLDGHVTLEVECLDRLYLNGCISRMATGLWAKPQLEKRNIDYEALDNGFLNCAEPEKLQQICDSLGAEEIDQLFRKWLQRVPLPLRGEDRKAGYDWDLSIWQMEVSLTQIFDRPLRGREFFEEIIREDSDLGRPDRMQLISTA